MCKTNKIIKIMAYILILAMLLQDVAWSNPSFFSKAQNPKTLQVPSAFNMIIPTKGRIDQEAIKMLLPYIIKKFKKDNINVNNCGLKITLPLNNDHLIIFDFSKETILCRIIDKKNKHYRDYRALISENGEIDISTAEESVLEKRQVTVLNAGGTIDMIGKKYRKTSMAVKKMINDNPDIKEIVGDDYKDVFEHAPDSSNIGPKEWEKLISQITNSIEIKKQQKNPGGIVITHGTDTLAYTSFLIALELANVKLSFPIVFTGSHSPMDVDNSDAFTNFRHALAVANNQNIPPGVFVVVGGRIYKPGQIVKVATRPLKDAPRYFESLEPPIGFIGNDLEVSFDKQRYNQMRQTYDQENKTPLKHFGYVEHVLASDASSIGMYEQLKKRLLERKRKDPELRYGVLIQGDFSKSPFLDKIQEIVVDLMRENIAVVIGSQKSWIKLKTTGASLKPIWLSYQKTWIKLMWLLKNNTQIKMLSNDLQDNYCGERPIPSKTKKGNSVFYRRLQRIKEREYYPSNYEEGMDTIMVFPGMDHDIFQGLKDKMLASNSMKKKICIVGLGNGHLPIGDKTVFQRITEYLDVKKPIFKEKLISLISFSDKQENQTPEDLSIAIASLLKSEDVVKVGDSDEKYLIYAKRVIKDALMYSHPILMEIGEMTDKGITILMDTSVKKGEVDLSLYEQGSFLYPIGVDTENIKGWHFPSMKKQPKKIKNTMKHGLLIGIILGLLISKIPFSSLFFTLHNTYLVYEAAYPLLSILVITFFLALLGDYIVQKLQHKNLIKNKRKINIRRLISIAAITAVLGGGGYYYWFNALDVLGQTPVAIRKKFFLQAFVFTPLFYIFFFFFNVFFVKTPLKKWFSPKPFKDTVNEIKHKFISIYKNDIVFWTFIHLFTFIFIPYFGEIGGMSDSLITSMKVLFVGVICVGWDAYVSLVSNSANTLFLSNKEKEHKEENSLWEKILNPFKAVKNFADKYKIYIILTYGTILILSIAPIYSAILTSVNSLTLYKLITLILTPIFLFLTYKYLNHGFEKKGKSMWTDDLNESELSNQDEIYQEWELDDPPMDQGIIIAKLAHDQEMTIQRKDKPIPLDELKENMFFHNFNNENDIATGLLETLISSSLSQKKVVLAFDRQVGGLFSVKVMDMINEIKWLKKEYKDLLENVDIDISNAETISEKIETGEYGKAEIFFFAPENMKSVTKGVEDKKNVHVSYVNKVSVSDTNVTEDVYYPLLEIIRTSIAKVYLPESLFNKIIPLLKDIQVETILKNNGTIIFNILPQAKKHGKWELVNKYASLKRALVAV